MKQHEAIIFDLDGTLADTLQMSVKASQEVINKNHCLRPSAVQIKEQFGKSEEAIFMHFCGPNWQKTFEDYADYFTRNVTPATLFPDIAEILRHLKASQIKAAVVTGRSAKSAEVILKAAGIRDYFDFVKAGSPQGSIKPRCIREILQAWGQNPRDTYYIGDIARDITDSREAGVHPLAASWHDFVEKDKQRQQNPLAIFHSTKEFADWVKK